MFQCCISLEFCSVKHISCRFENKANVFYLHTVMPSGMDTQAHMCSTKLIQETACKSLPVQPACIWIKNSLQRYSQHCSRSLWELSYKQFVHSGFGLLCYNMRPSSSDRYTPVWDVSYSTGLHVLSSTNLG